MVLLVIPTYFPLYFIDGMSFLVKGLSVTQRIYSIVLYTAIDGISLYDLQGEIGLRVVLVCNDHLLFATVDAFNS